MNLYINQHNALLNKIYSFSIILPNHFSEKCTITLQMCLNLLDRLYFSRGIKRHVTDLPMAYLHITVISDWVLAPL